MTRKIKNSINIIFLLILLGTTQNISAQSSNQVTITTLIKPADVTNFRSTTNFNPGSGECELKFTTSITPNVDLQTIYIDTGFSFSSIDLPPLYPPVEDTAIIPNLIIGAPTVFRHTSIASNIESEGVVTICIPTSNLPIPVILEPQNGDILTGNEITVIFDSTSLFLGTEYQITASKTNLADNPLGDPANDIQSEWISGIPAPYTLQLSTNNTWFIHVQSSAPGEGVSAFSNVVAVTLVPPPTVTPTPRRTAGGSSGPIIEGVQPISPTEEAAAVLPPGEEPEAPPGEAPEEPPSPPPEEVVGEPPPEEIIEVVPPEEELKEAAPEEGVLPLKEAYESFIDVIIEVNKDNTITDEEYDAIIDAVDVFVPAHETIIDAFKLIGDDVSLDRIVEIIEEDEAATREDFTPEEIGHVVSAIEGVTPRIAGDVINRFEELTPSDVGIVIKHIEEATPAQMAEMITWVESVETPVAISETIRQLSEILLITDLHIIIDTLEQDLPPEVYDELVEILYEDLLDMQETILDRGPPVLGCTRKEITEEIVDRFKLKELYADRDTACLADIEHCLYPFILHSNYADLNLEVGKYFIDVTTDGGLASSLSNVNPVTESEKEAIHAATRYGMVHGFYLDKINQSPFRPDWNATRIEILKLLNFSSGLRTIYLYEDEISAILGGKQNITRQRTLAPDIKPTPEGGWWYPLYHNAACDAGIISCAPDIYFGPEDICSIQWKNDIIARFMVYTFANPDTRFDDLDNDTLLNFDETNVFGTDPLNFDTDGDTLTDGDEINNYQTNPLMVDTDLDRLSDSAEVLTYRTNPLKVDTDNDDFSDYVEIQSGTDPLNPNSFPGDADDNGVDDDWEKQYGIFGLTLSGSDDFDGDGLSNLLEYFYGTDPTNPDTDGDGLSDGEEVLIYGTNPLIPTNLAEEGIRITNLRDGMVLNDLRPFVQGFAPVKGMTVKIHLRNEFGHEVVLGEAIVDENNAFVFKTPFDLMDGEFYLLVKGLDVANKQILQSPLIRLTIDSKLVMPQPLPERLSTKTLREEHILEGVRIEIQDQKPMVIGRAGFKSRVNATFESVTGASSVVADLAGGEFRFQASNALDYGNHELTLVAYKDADNIVSKSVHINFEIKEPFIDMLRGVALGEDLATTFFFWLILILIIVLVVTWFVWRHFKKRHMGKVPVKVKHGNGKR